MEQVKKTNKKTILVFSWMLVFLWMLFIFYMSAQDSTASSSFSRPIAEKVSELRLFRSLTSNQSLDRVEAVVRMIAHSTVFFILSMLVSIALICSGIKRSRVLFLSIALSLLYAFIDEFHQFFVPGRASEMLDIYLDTLGILLGTLLVILVSGLFVKRIGKTTRVDSPIINKIRRDEKVIATKAHTLQPPSIAKEKVTLESKEIPKKKLGQTKALKTEITIPVWAKFGFVISFSVLCSIISSNVAYMPIVAVVAFITMLIITVKTKFIDKNIKTINAPRMLTSIILSIFTIIRVYASFRLVANAYIAAEGTVIEDFYYNFIRSSLSAFAVPAIFVLWYIIIEKAKLFIKQIKFKKYEVIYIFAFTFAAFIALGYIYMRTSAFYNPTGNNNIIFSLDSFTLVNEFSYTNFTSSINSIFQPVFSLAAMPFGVISSIIAYPIAILPSVNITTASAMSLSIVNAFLLATSIILLARSINIKNKVFFVLIMSVSFPVISSLLLLSHNVVIVFYIAVFLYVLANTDYDYAPVLSVLSCAFLPFATLPIAMDKNRSRLKNSFKAYIYLIVAIVLCSDFLSFKDIIGTIKHVPRFAESILSGLRLSSMSILAPIGAVTATPNYMYVYTPSSFLYIVGAIVALFAFVGFIINRKNQIAKISLLSLIIGALFSLYFVATLVPSGIILYLICFSWAIIALIYMLAEKILRPDSWLFRILMIVATLSIAVYNLKAIREVVIFAFNYYS